MMGDTADGRPLVSACRQTSPVVLLTDRRLTCQHTLPVSIW